VLPAEGKKWTLRALAKRVLVREIFEYFELREDSKKSMEKSAS
jgi:hypothetical protein